MKKPRSPKSKSAEKKSGRAARGQKKDIASPEITRPAGAAQPDVLPRTAQRGVLYLVSTPIGNLGDISARALEILRGVDLVVAEDTRNSGNLLRHFDIRAEMQACHDHNENDIAPRLIEKLRAGRSIAMISDAGTPLVSDPGYRLVQAAIAAEIPIIPVPGANAILPALQLSGLPPRTFYFGGFLSSRGKVRRDELALLAALPSTLIFYEAPHRLAETLADAASVLGKDRRAAVVREISKKFEEARRGPLFMLRDHYARSEARGEIVIVIEGAMEVVKWSEDSVRAALAEAMTGGTPFREAVAIIHAQAGWAKRDVYDLALKLKSHETA